MQWFYSKNGNQLGPVSDSDLRAKISSGEIYQSDLVWREGMTDWLPVSKVAELAGVTRPSAIPPSQPSTQVSPANPSPYAPPSSPGVPVPYMAASPQASGLAISSLICGVLSIFLCGFITGIPAVICGHMALSRIDAPNQIYPQAGRGMAIAGLALGYLSFLISLGMLVVFFARPT